MLGRFTGPDRLARIAEVLLRQHPVQGNQAVADELAAVADLKSYAVGEILIQQDGDDNEIYFILDGRVSILVNGRQVAERKSGQHVGEMALIDPAGRRTATVIAAVDTTVARVEAEKFIPIADRHPSMWRRLAIELVERFRQRGASLSPPNPVPRVFIGSSVEGLAVAKAIQSGLSHSGANVETWTQNVFTASSGTMESLEKKAATTDLAILVATADDATKIRGKKVAVARDNVIFELGLFMGAIGRDRTVFVIPRGAKLHIPSDLLGITPLDYDPPPDLADLPARLGHVCTEIERLIKGKGAR